MKILFCGTPDFAKNVLQTIHERFPEDEIFVLSSPARRQGRGMALTQPPVGAYALEHNLPLYQPETLKDGAFSMVLEEMLPDVAVVAAYGKILPPYFISFPRFGCINVHASLLPRYRGASPIQRAIWDGLNETGVSIMQMDNGLDTGAVISKEKLTIEANDNTETLTQKLAKLGSNMICRVLDALHSGPVSAEKQDDSLATYAHKIRREDETLDFSKSARELDCMIRALAPRPYANTHLADGSEVKICLARPTETEAKDPGFVRTQKSRVFVSCCDFELELLRVKPQGKGEMDASALVNGRKLANGDVLR